MPTKLLSLKEFYNKRNKILIMRKTEGLGDILMHRMIFEDFKRVMSDAYIVFACLKKYTLAAQGHPYVDEVVDVETVDPNDFIISYNTSSSCIRYELFNLIKKHRADIWAEHCGVTLTKHEMYIPYIDQSIVNLGKNLVDSLGSGVKILFVPTATDILRSLNEDNIKEIVYHLRRQHCIVYGTHTKNLPIFEKLEVPVLKGTILDWMSYIQAADYIITVDTAAFHYAGGICKPMVGIFSNTDGKVFGKYFDFTLVQNGSIEEIKDSISKMLSCRQ